MKICFKPVIGCFEYVILHPAGSVEPFDLTGLDEIALRTELPRALEHLYGRTLSVWTTHGDGLPILQALELPFNFSWNPIPTHEDALDDLCRWAMTHSLISDRPWRPSWHWRETRDQPGATAIDPRTYSGKGDAEEFYGGPDPVP